MKYCALKWSSKLPVLTAGIMMAAFGIAAGGMAIAQQSQEKPKETVVNETKSANADVAPEADTGGAPVDPNSYKIGIEDVLTIKVWREPELSGNFVVRPDGKITLPLAGEMKADGRTPAEVKADVLTAYQKFVNKPEILVSVFRVGSKKYYMVGELLRTGTFPLVVPTRILEAINGAGGFREFANRKNVTILRGSERIRFNYNDVIQGKKMEQNIYLQNGDHVIVK